MEPPILYLRIAALARLLAAVAACGVCLVPATAAPAPVPRHWAFVVGVGRTTDPAIPPPPVTAQDARDLAEALGAAGYEVFALADDAREERLKPTRSNVLVQTQRFVADPRIQPGDVVVVVFAGHVYAARDAAYLAASDTFESHLSLTGVPVAYLRDLLVACRAGTKLLILDAPVNAAAPAGAKSVPVERVAASLRAAGISVLAACRDGQKPWVARDLPGVPDGRGSAFAHFLARGLRGDADRDRDGAVSLAELARFASEAVASWARQAGLEQDPVVALAGEGTAAVAQVPRQPVQTAGSQRPAVAPPPGAARPPAPAPTRPSPPASAVPAPGAPATRLPLPPAPAPPPAAPSLVDDVREVSLPAAFTQVKVGGGGRYFAFHLKDGSRAVVVDVAEARRVGEIPLVAEDAVLAAGLEKLVIAFPGQKLLQRYTLDTLQRERTAPLPTGSLQAAILGPTSRGPLFLFAGGGLSAVDLETLEPTLKGKPMLGGDPRHGFRVRASFDGRVFTGWHAGLSPDPCRWLRLAATGETATGTLPGEMSHAMRWFQASADGSLFFDHGAGIYDAHARDVSTSALRGSLLMPAVDPRYFVALRGTSLSLCTTCDRRALLTLEGLEELRAGAPFVDPLADPRVYYIPTLNRLVTLPVEGNRVVIRTVDLLAALGRQGGGYLFVDSVPPAKVAAGSALSYQVAAHSQAGGVRYALESGPPGMTVSPAGLVEWRVPTEAAGKTVQVILTLRDASGKETPHSFTLAVVGR